MENVYGFQNANLMVPQDVARAAYEGIMNEKTLVVPGAMNKAIVAAKRILTEGAQASLNEMFSSRGAPSQKWGLGIHHSREDLEFYPYLS